MELFQNRCFVGCLTGWLIDVVGEVILIQPGSSLTLVVDGNELGANVK